MKELLKTGAVVLFSGGQDSTTCLYWAIKNYSKVYALTFNYGQRHLIELDAAKKIANFAGVNHTILNISGLDQIGGSSLVSKEIPISNENSTSDGLPTSFVPGRNLIFLTYAAAFAYQVNAAVLVTGVCQTDYSGYPDCRKNTIETLNSAINLGIEAEFIIETPLMHLSKSETVKLAEEVGAMTALSYSHTCYNGVFPPCNTCPACALRAKGFSEAGIKDPLLDSVLD